MIIKRGIGTWKKGHVRFQPTQRSCVLLSGETLGGKLRGTYTYFLSVCIIALLPFFVDCATKGNLTLQKITSPSGK